MRDYGGMISFLVDDERQARDAVARTRVWSLAESLGGVESLIETPAQMTHSSTADAPFATPPNLVRLSVGIESADDLIEDLEQALALIGQRRCRRRAATTTARPAPGRPHRTAPAAPATSRMNQAR